MKKLFLPIFLGVLVLITSLKANAQNVIVSEDFAKFTEGSIENPSSKDVADEYTTYIPAELMQKEGWTGAAIHQAGGCCFVSNYTSEWDIEDGYLNTPLGDYSGKITIKFRARSQKKHDAPEHIYVNVAFRSETLGGNNFELSDEWKTYTTTLNIEANDKSQQAIVQFSATEEIKFFIDDIEISRQKALIPYPKVDGYESLKTNGFTAKWLPLEGIDTYLVSVYSKAEYQEKDSIAEYFDHLNLDSDNKPVSNDFGRFSASLSSEHPVYIGSENSKSGNQALHFINGDWLELKASNKPLVHASFWAKSPSNSLKGSVIVEQYLGTEWMEALEIDSKGMPEFKFVDLSKHLNFNTTAIRISYKGEGEIYFDNLKVYYEPDHQYAENYQDREVKNSTQIEVEGLDPETDYFFSVKSKKEQEISLPSEEVFVYGLITPASLEATDIDTDRFTAQWGASPKAQGYVLENYNLIKATEATEYVIYDEKFDKVKVGETNPEKAKAGKQENSYLDEYTQYPGWMGANLIMADGMMGTKGFSAAITTPNIILQPRGNSRKVKVNLTVWAEKGTDLAIQVNGKRPEELAPIHFDETGFLEREVTFNYSDKADLHLSFLSWSGEPFLLDALKVSVALEGNDSVSFINNRINIKNKQTTYPIQGLINEKNHTYFYHVRAFRIIGKDVIFSEFSSDTNVTLKEKEISLITNRDSKEDVIFSDGHLISSKDQLVSIYDIEGKLILKQYLHIGESLSLREYSQGLLIIQTQQKVYKITLR